MHHYDSLRKFGPLRVRCTRLVLELPVFQLVIAALRYRLRPSGYNGANLPTACPLVNRIVCF